MKPIIGIISTYSTTDKITVSDDVIKACEEALGEPIVIVTKAEEEVGENVLSMCSGFIFQGGSYSSDFHYKIVEYAYKNNKPIMGICLGMHILAKYFFGAGSVSLIANTKISNHLTTYDKKENIMHNINIAKESSLYQIFGSNILVNSRHQKIVTNVLSPFIISSKSEDDLIESFELIDKNNYIVAFQFHPEDIKETHIIFKRFVQICKERIWKKD